METEEKNKLFVGNLSYALEEDALLELFSNIEGVEVVEAKIITDKFSGRSKGFGFVTVKDAEQAEKAIAEMNNKEVDGRQIFVSVARPQEKREKFDRSNDRRRSYR